MEGRRVLGGRYTLLNELGSGGMAVVWHARDEVLGRPVAVKLLAARSAGDPHSRARIRDEARAAANLLHPNIAQVYDFGEATDGQIPLPYVVMELVNGPTLQDRAMSGPLPPRTIFRICGEVAAALAYAHAAGLVHRDIKMANILVTKSGAKVVDFGIAAAIGPLSEDMLVGTPAYLAPERLTGDAVVPASDVYALGVLLYRLLAGHPPWSVESTTEMFEAHVWVEPAPLPALAGVPPTVADLVGRCLRKDPRSRPTASEVSSALADAAEAAPITEDVRRETALHQAPAVAAMASGRPAPAELAPDLTPATWAFAPGRPGHAEPSAPSAPPGWVPHPRPAGGPRNGVPVGSAAAVGPARSGGARPAGAGGGGAPRVQPRKRRYLLAGGGLAGLIGAVLVAWFVSSNGNVGGEPFAAAASAPARGVIVAPSAPVSIASLPAVTSQPAPLASAGSGSPTPSRPARTSRPPADGAPAQPGQQDNPPTTPSTTATTEFDPPPLDPPPVGTRLIVTGGVVYATCSAVSAELTGWEPASGFTVAGVDPGPAAMAMITFAGTDAWYEATVTCVDGSPTSVVVQV
ncbi:MAG TPA: protein kinase [Actinoplanes sp.]